MEKTKGKTDTANEYKCKRKEAHKDNFTALLGAVKYFCFFGMMVSSAAGEVGQKIAAG
jgi:hypothetical protein